MVLCSTVQSDWKSGFRRLTSKILKSYKESMLELAICYKSAPNIFRGRFQSEVATVMRNSRYFNRNAWFSHQPYDQVLSFAYFCIASGDSPYFWGMFVFSPLFVRLDSRPFKTNWITSSRVPLLLERKQTYSQTEWKVPLIPQRAQTCHAVDLSDILRELKDP